MLCRLFSLVAAGFLYFVTAASPTEQDVAPVTNFNVLTINVAGLPESYDPCGAPDEDKEMNTMYIGKILSHYYYGIVNVQEDVSHHTTLYEYNEHPYRTVNTGDIQDSSGLNTLSNFPFIGSSSTTWAYCSDKPKHDFDCNSNKGFTFMRVRMEKGVYIDMINLHTDAGTGVHDQSARRLNIDQVTEFIQTHSIGNAVIVFGNTNSLYTRSRDNIRILTAQSGLKDAWVQAIGGTIPTPGDVKTYHREVVDKVFYRGSAVINLNSTGFFYDTSRFLSPEGSGLTNHDPVRVEFEYSLTDGLRQSDLFGESYGHWFNDLPSLPPAPKLASITLRGANRLDGLTFNLLTLRKGFRHGGKGGKAYSITLAPTEYIVSVKLCWGNKNVPTTRIFFAKVTTSNGQIVQAGKETEDCDTALTPNGYDVVGGYGQQGKEIDQLGFIYARRQ
ncbi:endonuclease/exonuclease/phosphatase family protein [Rhizoctonia solani AG-3 Rhs1AP]|uniref:Endonuclease/exonuclease/phosphatase family protein n=2 Tax=Rhizoctonia solani AG-3 TaxID=1086053 RepID=A0A074SFA8_9AGAM|nr:endonuclease/exonuclease/phosphatase family protein [Rhizoctonia solani AG-3 Rhs1AP]KEP48692.1 endonuclease/exonuclease/phosphatase family protein [Rhizoctonia solani 123E]